MNARPEMQVGLAAARRLYRAFAARDAPGILDALHGEFVGHVSRGMPLGVGGHHVGREAMLRDVWAPVFSEYDIAPEAEELLEASGDRVVAVGHYRGSRRSTGEPVEAAFAHVLTVRDGLIVELRQITDTVSWGRSSDP